jgi:hypothetical protein
VYGYGIEFIFYGFGDFIDNNYEPIAKPIIYRAFSPWTPDALNFLGLRPRLIWDAPLALLKLDISAA